MIETIEKLETMQGCACLKNLYAGARPRWQVFTPLLTEKISFKVYYKKNHGTKLGLAILEMTPSFFNQYGIYNNSSFWDILEENTVIPIYGVIWKENKLPLI
jgi:hypothetical protein